MVLIGSQLLRVVVYGWLVVVMPTVIVVQAADIDRAPANGSGLVRLVRAIEHSAPEVQADFAAIALDVMIEAYERELDKAQSSTRRLSQRERNKRWRWSGAARRFLEQAYVAREALYSGARVELIAGSPVEVQLLIDEQLVPVTAPRIDQPDVLENAVLAAFCDLHTCEQALVAGLAPGLSSPGGGWSLRQGMGSTYMTHDGLGFMFTDLHDRALKEELCHRAAAELREVVSILKRAYLLGIDIDWHAVRVVHAATGGAERLVLDSRGRGARVSAPILLRAPGVLNVARPWLRARMWDQHAEQFFPRADVLFDNVLVRG